MPTFPRLLLHRNTVFLSAVFVVALGGELAIDAGVERFWRWKNRGKLWEDLEGRIGNL